jgi:hypothetical protein
MAAGRGRVFPGSIAGVVTNTGFGSMPAGWIMVTQHSLTKGEKGKMDTIKNCFILVVVYVVAIWAGTALVSYNRLSQRVNTLEKQVSITEVKTNAIYLAKAYHVYEVDATPTKSPAPMKPKGWK